MAAKSPQVGEWDDLRKEVRSLAPYPSADQASSAPITVYRLEDWKPSWKPNCQLLANLARRWMALSAHEEKAGLPTIRCGSCTSHAGFVLLTYWNIMQIL